MACLLDVTCNIQYIKVHADGALHCMCLLSAPCSLWSLNPLHITAYHLQRRGFGCVLRQHSSLSSTVSAAQLQQAATHPVFRQDPVACCV